MKVKFEFEGITFEIDAEATREGGDVVKVPDGRFLELTCAESFPPKVDSIKVVSGPYNVGKHEGQIWEAKIVE